MRKRKFKTVRIQEVNCGAVLEACSGARIVVGVDVAKSAQFAAVLDDVGELRALVKWAHPAETPDFVQLCRGLAANGQRVEVAMEPTGTYGDPIRAHLLAKDIPVYRVSPKRVHDAAEVYDGVPSLHDRKAAWLVAKLHREGTSEVWPLPSTEQRELRATLDLADHYDLAEQRLLGKLEGLTARHWPELTGLLALTRATPLLLLQHFGSPQAVAKRADEAKAFMRKKAKGFLEEHIIDEVVASAARQPADMLPAEIELLRTLAGEAYAARAAGKKVKRALKRLLDGQCLPTLQDAAGVMLAAALLATGSDPRTLPNAAATVKSCGLNLREFSSGTKDGKLHISKRGDGRIRRHLYMCALRMVKNDPIVRAWYHRKVERQGGDMKIKAIVAVMRKLMKAMWHVARGEAFDASKLFDVRRLALPASA